MRLPDTTAANRDSAEFFIEKILQIYGSLSRLPNLQPSPTVNAYFNELVNICINPLDEQTTRKILNSQSICDIKVHLREICSTAEFQLEKHWAEKALCVTSPRNQLISKDAAAVPHASKFLATFPYYSNYADLTRLELGALLLAGSSVPRRIAFLGSGPLPLTSLCLADSLDTNPKLPLTILNIDRDAEAVSQSKELCRHLGQRAQSMAFQCADVADTSLDLMDCDVVYLAALVGVTSGAKEKLLLSIAKRMRPGAYMVLRTAHSLRTLLYPELNVNTTALLEVMEPCMILHPCNYVVNSVIITRIKDLDM